MVALSPSSLTLCLSRWTWVIIIIATIAKTNCPIRILLGSGNALLMATVPSYICSVAPPSGNLVKRLPYLKDDLTIFLSNVEIARSENQLWVCEVGIVFNYHLGNCLESVRGSILNCYGIAIGLGLIYSVAIGIQVKVQSNKIPVTIVKSWYWCNLEINSLGR